MSRDIKMGVRHGYRFEVMRSGPEAIILCYDEDGDEYEVGVYGNNQKTFNCPGCGKILLPKWKLELPELTEAEQNIMVMAEDGVRTLTPEEVADIKDEIEAHRERLKKR